MNGMGGMMHGGGMMGPFGQMQQLMQMWHMMMDDDYTGNGNGGCYGYHCKKRRVEGLSNGYKRKGLSDEQTFDRMMNRMRRRRMMIDGTVDMVEWMGVRKCLIVGGEELCVVVFDGDGWEVEIEIVGRGESKEGGVELDWWDMQWSNFKMEQLFEVFGGLNANESGVVDEDDDEGVMDYYVGLFAGSLVGGMLRNERLLFADAYDDERMGLDMDDGVVDYFETISYGLTVDGDTTFGCGMFVDGYRLCVNETKVFYFVKDTTDDGGSIDDDPPIDWTNEEDDNDDEDDGDRIRILFEEFTRHMIERELESTTFSIDSDADWTEVEIVNGGEDIRRVCDYVAMVKLCVEYDEGAAHGDEYYVSVQRMVEQHRKDLILQHAERINEWLKWSVLD